MAGLSGMPPASMALSSSLPRCSSGASLARGANKPASDFSSLALRFARDPTLNCSRMTCVAPSLHEHARNRQANLNSLQPALHRIASDHGALQGRADHLAAPLEFLE